MISKKAKDILDRSYEGGHVLHENAVNAVKAAEEEMRLKAIEAFNVAMIFYTSPPGLTEEEALKHFIACLDQVFDSDRSVFPNNQICGNCDAYCECQKTGAEHNDAACPGFDDSVLSQIKKGIKYECIKECCNINFSDLTLKRTFVPGRIYEFEGEPDKNYFKRIPGQSKTKKCESSGNKK
ncbi:MAG: hypothetical protein PEPC_01732 [Peptostreptococcus russellii]